MMRREEILSKGRYTHPQVADLVSVKQYIIVKHEGKKQLLLRMSNDRGEIATALSLRVHQYNVRGDIIATEKIELDKLRAKANTDFVLSSPVILPDSCVDFRVDVISVSYGDYTYAVIGGETHITYRKQETVNKKDIVDKDKLSHRLGGKKHAVSVRSLRAPFMLIIVCAAILLAMAGFIISQMNNFIATETVFTLDKIEYEILSEDKQNGELRIIGYKGKAQSIIFPEEIEGHPVVSVAPTAFAGTDIVGITFNGNVEIEDGAFADCEKLQKVVLHKTEKIGKNAFAGCVKLKNVQLGDRLNDIGTRAFEGCSALKSVVLPESLTIIGDGAFAKCTSLEALTIPDGIRSVGSGIVRGCSNLGTLTVPYIGSTLDDDEKLGYLYGVESKGSLYNALHTVNVTVDTVISDNTFADCDSILNVEYTAPVTYVGENAFNGCSGLLDFEFDDSITYIGESAFEGCASMKADVNIPEGITVVEKATFKGCASVLTASLPETLEIVGVDSFNGCASLKSLYIPQSVQKICDGSLMGCSSLEDLTVPFVGTEADNPQPMSAIFGNEGAASLRQITVTGSNSSAVCDEAFAGLDSLRTVYLSDSITYIGTKAFYGCSSLMTLAMSKEVTEIGEYAFAGCESLTLINLPDKITCIGNGTFEGCASLYEITIPESVTQIGTSAFFGCASLNDIIWHEKITEIGESAFAGCASLGSISIPAAMTEIPNNAFENCSELTLVAIPATVTNIGERAFAGCSSLRGMDLPAHLETLHSGAFADCGSMISFTIPASVTEIGSGVLQGCTSLEELTVGFMSATADENGESGRLGFFFDSEEGLNSSVPSTLKYVTLTSSTIISERAFADCASLYSVVLPVSINTIGAGAFSGCSSLGYMLIPDDVKIVSERAFENCTSLTYVDFPRNLDEISNYAFVGCSALSEIKIPNRLDKIGEGTFSGCTALTVVSIPKDVQEIGYGAFEGCTSVTELTIPFIGASRAGDTPLSHIFGGSADSLTTVTITDITHIPDSAFHGFNALRTVNLPSNLYTIGIRAFAECAAIETLTIPSTVTAIGEGAFADCSALKELTLPFVGTERFNGSTIHNLFTTGVPATLEKVTVTNTTVISPSCFENCSAIKEIALDCDIAVIGNNAFAGCTALKNIELPDTVVTIGDRAFLDCVNINSVTLPATLTAIGEDAFYGCRMLFEVFNRGTDANLYVECGSEDHGYVGYYAINVYHEGDPVNKASKDGFVFLEKNEDSTWHLISYYSENGIYSFPENFMGVVEDVSEYYIPAYMFYGDLGVVEVTLPAAARGLGEYLFYGCENLTSVTFVESFVDDIPDSCFEGCIAMSKFNLPDTVESIGSRAFYDCKALTTITLPQTLQSIGSEAFRKCDSLLEVYNLTSFPISVGSTKYGYVAYRAYIVHNSPYAEMLHDVNVNGLDFKKSDDHWFLVGYSGMDSELNLSSFVYNNKLVDSYVIMASAFAKNTTITSLNVSDAVKSIGASAFKNCTALTSVSFAENYTLTEFRSNWFTGCSSLNSIVMLPNLAGINEDAFEGYTALETISFADNMIIPELPVSLFHPCESLKHVMLPNGLVTIDAAMFEGNQTIVSVSFGSNENITTLPANIFNSCYALETVVLPLNLTVIDSNAFGNCSALSSLDLPSSVYMIADNAFINCYALKSITFPESLQYIGYYSFASSGLESISLPSNVENVGSGAFSGCSQLTSADLSAATKLTYIANDTFCYCTSLSSVKLPRNVTYIDSMAFYCCQALESITLPRSLTDIYYAAFSNCSALKSVTMNNSLSTIGDCAFEYCAFEEISLPASLSSIGNNAFAGCASLKSIDLPDNCTYVGYSAFYDCTSLTSADLRGCVTLGGSAFQNCSALTSVNLAGCTDIGGGAFQYCTALTEISLEGCQSVGGYAFQGCTSLVSVYLDGVVWIGDYAFADCTSLSNCAIASSVQNIGSGAFTNCTSITSVYLGSNIYELGTAIFEGCTMLSYADLSEAVNVTTVPTNMFYGCGSLATVFLPPQTKTISSRAFNDCVALESIVIPSSVRSIRSNAFRGCTALRELWNLSSIELIPGETSNGYAAAYAIKVHTNESDRPLTYDTFTQDGVTYHLAYAPSSGETFLYAIDGEAVDGWFYLPDVGAQYSITHHVTLSNIDNIYVDDSITYIHPKAWENIGYATVYYTGDEYSWYDLVAISGIGYGGFYWYTNCVHDYYNNWCYDKDGNITTEINTWSETVTVVPTCQTEGQVRRICDRCGVVEYVVLPVSGHVVGADGNCTVCSVKLVSSDNESKYITYVDPYTFVSDGKGAYVSNNKNLDETVATMIFTANADMTIGIHYSVSSEGGCDVFTIRKNGEHLVDISGEEYVRYLILDLVDGDVVEFEYSKDGSVSTGTDTATVHSIAIIKTTEVEIPEVEPDDPEIGTDSSDVETDVETESETEPSIDDVIEDET